MSHNASAFQINENVNVLGQAFQPPYSLYDGTDWGAAQSGVINLTYNSKDYSGILFNTDTFGATAKKGDYVVFSGYAVSNMALYSSEEFFNVGGFFTQSSHSTVCSITDFAFPAMQKYVRGTTTLTRYNYEATCRLRTDLASSGNITINLRISPKLVTQGSTFDFGVSNALLLRPSDATKKEEDAANENIEQNETDSNSSSSDAENASQSLLSAIGSFVSAITSASPSNCNIDGDMGKFDIGQVNLCSNPVPTYMQVISSLILICICIPFAIIMFNRFIALFRSFQT